MRNSNASLEKNRPAFFAAGLLLAFSLTLVSFEWRTPFTEPEPRVTEGIYEEPITLTVTLAEPDKEVKRPESPKEPEPITDQIELVDKKVIETLAYDPFENLEEPTFGDEPLEPDVEDEYFGVLPFADENPSYCGGEKAMLEFLGKNLEYPEIPLSMGVSGTVYVKFVVGKNGKLRDAKVARPVDPWFRCRSLKSCKNARLL